MRIDYHMHSVLSFDGKSSAEDMARAAAHCGLDEIAFTEHYDLDPLDPAHFPLTDSEKYEAGIQGLRELGLPLRIRMGAEFGVACETLEQYQKLYESRHFDFILCSQHFVHGVDPFNPEYFEGKTQTQAYGEYLEEMYRTLSVYNGYSVVGHIGYVSKYYKGSERPIRLTMAHHGDIIDEILRLVIQKGKGIEINSAAVAHTGEPMPTYEIMARYRELGGEIVTTGSDAHDTGRVGEHIAEMTERLKGLGFKYICTFENMLPSFHAI